MELDTVYGNAGRKSFRGQKRLDTRVEVHVSAGKLLPIVIYNIK